MKSIPNSPDVVSTERGAYCFDEHAQKRKDIYVLEKANETVERLIGRPIVEIAGLAAALRYEMEETNAADQD